MRVYVPSTLALLGVRLTAGQPAPGVELVEPGTTAYAVTPALREWYREGDLEELEYVAMTHAARASFRLLAAEQPASGQGPDRTGDGPADEERAAPRRVVLAADVPDAAVHQAPGVDVAAVRLDVAVPFEALASAHVDDLAAAADLRAALASLGAAGAADEETAFLLDGLDDHELQWYAATEIAFLLD